MQRKIKVAKEIAELDGDEMTRVRALHVNTHVLR